MIDMIYELKANKKNYYQQEFITKNISTEGNRIEALLKSLCNSIM